MEDAVSREELLELKNKINASFDQLAEYVVNFQDRFSVLEARLDKFNQKSGQKI